MSDEKAGEINVTVGTAPEAVIAERSADATLELIEKLGETVEPLTAEGAKELKWKLYLRLIPLLIVLNLWLFVSI